MNSRTLLALGSAALVAVAVHLPAGGAAFAQVPERMILVGAPPLGPTWLLGEDGAPIPAGCGPEAARILLAYYDRRYGYLFLADGPAAAIAELYELMGTIIVVWGGERQGLTWPWAFTAGLRAYIERRCPRGVALGTADGSLAVVFAKSVELIQRGVPHVVLFDWAGRGGIFPNHYAVVVGYDISGERRHLVLNPGWGYDFQLLDMSDPAVAPVALFWIEEIPDPPYGEPGVALGPSSAAGMWERNEGGDARFRPLLRLHGDPQSVVRWPPSTRVEFPVSGVDDLAIAIWDAR
ncbi:hypothetical protein H5T55_04090 [Candidatus Bipolaricaulota bacterium]|nr:hypothetical protein [Candidatus Bipolaricaulota bacterium]